MRACCGATTLGARPGTHPASRIRAPAPAPLITRRMCRPFPALPWVVGGRMALAGRSLPAQHLEDFFLHRGHLLLVQAGVDNVVLRAGAGAAQPQHLLPGLRARLLELQPLAPHEQQRDDVAEVHAVRFRLALQPREAVHQQLVVDPQPRLLLLGGDAAGPEAERVRRGAVPGVAGVIVADELAALVEEDAVELLPGPQLAPRRRTAPRVRLNLVVGHACPFPPAACRAAGCGT